MKKGDTVRFTRNFEGRCEEENGDVTMASIPKGTKAFILETDKHLMSMKRYNDRHKDLDIMNKCLGRLGIRLLFGAKNIRYGIWNDDYYPIESCRMVLVEKVKIPLTLSGFSLIEYFRYL